MSYTRISLNNTEWPIGPNAKPLSKTDRLNGGKYSCGTETGSGVGCAHGGNTSLIATILWKQTQFSMN